MHDAHRERSDRGAGAQKIEGSLDEKILGALKQGQAFDYNGTLYVADKNVRKK